MKARCVRSPNRGHPRHNDDLFGRRTHGSHSPLRNSGRRQAVRFPGYRSLSLKFITAVLTCFCLSCHLPLLNPSFPAGTTIVVKTPGVINTYYFCSDETARVHLSLSKYINHKRFGTYKNDGHDIQIVWNRELGTQGVGRPFNCTNGECIYPNYRPFQKNLHLEEKLNLSKRRAQGTVTLKGFNGVCDPFWYY